MLQVEDIGKRINEMRSWPRREPGPVFLSWYEFSAVSVQINVIEARAKLGLEAGEEELDRLWKWRARLAKAIVDAAAPTIEDAILKSTISTSLLSEGALRVVLTPQTLEDFDRAVGDDGECLEALEPELWQLSRRVQKQVVELETRWKRMDDREERRQANSLSLDAASLEKSWNELHESVWRVARYETMTAAGLRAKGQMFRDLSASFSAMDGLVALQDSYLRDFDHLAYRRLHGRDAPMPRRSVG